MVFLRKKHANLNHSSRSRSQSTSSNKHQNSAPPTPSSPGFDLPSVPIQLPSEYSRTRSPALHAQSSAPASATANAVEDKTKLHASTEPNLTKINSNETFAKGQRNSVAANTSSTTSDAGIATTTRQSSNGSIGSQSVDKLLFSWDSTNPEEWTMVRVLSWFRFNDFDEAWIAYFRKRQLQGHRFLKLMAYDNFIEHEANLPQTKFSTYKRFQYLLKRTLEQNVMNGHNRNKSDKSTGSRSSSDSVKIKNGPKQEAEHIRSISETMTSRKIAGDLFDEKVRSHQKTSSGSSLYRRSFISLRGNSSQNSSKAETITNLNIPARPLSTFDASSQTDHSTQRISSSPISPTCPGFFRRQHKSSSSESSIFNTLFGPGAASGSNATTKVTENNGSIDTPKSSSLESFAKERPGICPIDSSSSKRSIPSTDDKTGLWGKLKKRTGQSDSITLPNPGSLSDTNLPEYKSVVNTKQSSANLPEDKPPDNDKPLESEFKWEDFILEKRYYPMKNSESRDRYILITRDNKSFIPLNVSMITNLEELKDSMALTLGIRHKNYTVHLTDFGCDIGCSIQDDLLETLRNNLFNNVPNKFYIKDQMKIQLRPEVKVAGSEVAVPLRAVKSKGSLKSAASSNLNSNDDASTITSCSDVTSFDDIAHASGRTVYPQTPNSYYGAAAIASNPEVDYWSFKESQNGDASLPRVSRNRTKNSRKSSGSELASSFSNNSCHSFQVIRKKSGNEIDFDNRRTSPYVNPDFAPRREAPKPPHGSQTSLVSSPPGSLNSSPKMKKSRGSINTLKRKARPPPPPTMLNHLSTRTSTGSLRGSQGSTLSPSESMVHSYTPGSTQVLVPQPYKGKNGSIKSTSSSGPIENSKAPYNYHTLRSRSSSIKSVANAPEVLNRASTKRIISSASAADVFDENDISFADAPELSDTDDEQAGSDSSDDIIWSSESKRKTSQGIVNPTISIEKPPEKLDTESHSDEEILESPKKLAPTRKMTLRPSPEVVYQNLERFFPGTDLDRPIVEGTTPPPSPQNVKATSPIINQYPKESPTSESRSPVNSRMGTPQTMIAKPTNNSQEIITPRSNSLKIPKRTKTIRIIAREASEARRDSKVRSMGRKNTKMWGTRVVEVTDKKMVAINKSKNSNGEYKEFAWIKGEMIGKGSFGSVFLGLNVTTGEMIAVKQVEVPRYGSQDETTLSVLEALRSEVATLKDLDHTNIVQYLGFENKNYVYSLFLEYVAGGSVGSLIRLYGKFDENLIRFLAVQVLRGLSYLHSKKILHRDMKADNLLLDVDGICKISDFGISKKSNNIYSNSDMTMRGTVFWMAPEMVDTKQGYSAKVDIWSLGCVVLEMFAGKRPWSNLEVVAAMFKIGKFKSAPPIPEDTQKIISAEGKEFLDACFEINPEKRPTADELLSHPFCIVDKEFVFKETS